MQKCITINLVNACTPRSAPLGQVLFIEYGKPLPLHFILARNVQEALSGISFPFYVFEIKVVQQLNSMCNVNVKKKQKDTQMSVKQ